MYYSIQYFSEDVIPELQKNQKIFMQDPSRLEECEARIKQLMLELGCHILSEMLQECNTMLENSAKRRDNWQIKDRTEKSLLTSLGTITFIHTRFQNKTTKKTAYLLDRMMGLKPHTRLSPDARVCLLKEAARSSYQKAGELWEGKECVSRETVMRHVHKLNFPPIQEEEGIEKKQVKRLYVEADEDHIALQFHKEKGDVRRWKGHGDNSQIIKLVYVHEGYEEAEAKRKKLKEVMYFGGLYSGKENGELWREVKEYIERRYDGKPLERIYFQSDGGSWMKKGIEELGGRFVLDEFHIKKYVKKLMRILGEEEGKERVLRYLEKGERKKLEEWVEKKWEVLEEKDRKKTEEIMGYIRKNWKGIRRRMSGEEGVIGSSTESHISHVLSARMSSRPMGWSRKGAGKLSKLRIYWKNGRKVEELIEEKECVQKEKREEERISFSAHEMISWEKRAQKKNGKYIEALQARVSRQTGMKVYFQAAIAGICG